MTYLIRTLGAGLSLLLCLTAQSMAATPLPEHWKENSALIHTVTAPYIDVHTFAGRGYPIFHVVEQNEKFLIIKRRNDWFNIETIDGKNGWVARKNMNGTLDENRVMVDFNYGSWKEHTKNSFEAGLTVGTLDGIIAYSPFLAYSFTSNLRAEIKYTQAFGESSNLKLAALNLTYQPLPFWRISPFFRVGSGFIQINPSTILQPDREDPILTVGGGFVFYASSRLVLRVEYDNHTIMTTRNVNEEVEEWKAGFGVLF